MKLSTNVLSTLTRAFSTTPPLQVLLNKASIHYRPCLAQDPFPTSPVLSLRNREFAMSPKSSLWPVQKEALAKAPLPVPPPKVNSNESSQSSPSNGSKGKTSRNPRCRYFRSFNSSTSFALRRTTHHRT
jgi:hypothetical protein